MSTTKILGRQVSLGIAKEATRGTAESSADFFLPFDEGTIDEKQDQVVAEQSEGVIEGSTGIDPTKKYISGTIKGPVTDKAFPLLLNAVCGSLSSASNADSSGNVYDHTITVGQSVQHQSLTLFIDDPSATSNAQDYVHALTVIDKLELDFSAGKYVSYTATIMGKSGSQTAVTPSTPDENRFRPQDVTVGYASTLSGLSSPTTVKVKSLKLTISGSTEDDQVFGDISPNDYLNKSFTIEGQLDATWDDEATWKTLFTGDTSKALQIDIKNSDVTIGTAANPEIKIQLAKVTFTSLTKPFKVGDIVRQTVAFKAHYSISDSKMLSVVATNLQTSY